MSVLIVMKMYFLIRFVKGTKPGHKTGFDIDEDDLSELEQFHDVIVASAIFGTNKCHN